MASPVTTLLSNIFPLAVPPGAPPPLRTRDDDVSAPLAPPPPQARDDDVSAPLAPPPPQARDDDVAIPPGAPRPRARDDDVSAPLAPPPPQARDDDVSAPLAPPPPQARDDDVAVPPGAPRPRARDDDVAVPPGPPRPRAGDDNVSAPGAPRPPFRDDDVAVPPGPPRPRAEDDNVSAPGAPPPPTARERPIPLSSDDVSAPGAPPPPQARDDDVAVPPGPPRPRARDDDVAVPPGPPRPRARDDDVSAPLAPPPPQARDDDVAVPPGPPRPRAEDDNVSAPGAPPPPTARERPIPLSSDDVSTPGAPLAPPPSQARDDDVAVPPGPPRPRARDDDVAVPPGPPRPKARDDDVAVPPGPPRPRAGDDNVSAPGAPPPLQARDDDVAVPPGAPRPRARDDDVAAPPGAPPLPRARDGDVSAPGAPPPPTARDDDVSTPPVTSHPLRRPADDDVDARPIGAPLPRASSPDLDDVNARPIGAPPPSGLDSDEVFTAPGASPLTLDQVNRLLSAPSLDLAEMDQRFPAYSGWAPDGFDSRDRQYKPSNGVPEWGQSINLRAKYPKFWIDFYHQGNTGSCAAHAISAGYAYEVNKLAKPKNPDDPLPLFKPSRSFIYYNARQGKAKHEIPNAEARVADNGSTLRVAMQSLHQFGICKEVSWPLREETIGWYPGPYAYYEAKKRGVRDFQFKRLDVQRNGKERDIVTDGIQSQDAAVKEVALKKAEDDGQELLNNLRSCLNDGHPVAFGFTFYVPNESTKRFDNDTVDSPYPKVSRWCVKDIPAERRHIGPDYTNRPTKSEGGEWVHDRHGVLAIGFLDDKSDSDKNKGYFLCQNSWGADEEYKMTPTFLIPYSYVTDFEGSRDFWMIDLEAKPELQANSVTNGNTNGTTNGTTNGGA